MLSERVIGGRLGPRARRLTVAVLAATTMLGVSSATAKDFGPGDVRLCDAQRCLPIRDRSLLRALSVYIFDGPRPSPARAPRDGAPALRLGFSGGGAAGLVGSARLDRFVSYGVVCGRFRRGHWYRLPEGIARRLRELGAPLVPLRVGARPLPRSC